MFESLSHSRPKSLNRGLVLVRLADVDQQSFPFTEGYLACGPAPYVSNVRSEQLPPLCREDTLSPVQKEVRTQEGGPEGPQRRAQGLRVEHHAHPPRGRSMRAPSSLITALRVSVSVSPLSE